MLEAKILPILYVLAIQGRWTEFTSFLAFGQVLVDNARKLDQQAIDETFDTATATNANIDAVSK